ncbi:MAG: lytic transglycosylase domain-containing protein, partial [Thiothrix sp.]|uniref:lytic transglycosylase domain-containing protein n=1 Tax=Thiothrix sp. TaxID=1032 RepID=UPI002628BF51
MGNNWWQVGLALLLLLLAGTANATCWQDASERYNVPVPLLRAIAEVESSNRARVVARNTNGSLDMGFMQINGWWLPQLAKYGISENELMNPCTSLHVGGWILAQNIRQMGYGWEAVGAYGAGTKKDKAAARLKYARKVWKVLDRQVAQGLGKQPEPE